MCHRYTWAAICVATAVLSLVACGPAGSSYQEIPGSPPFGGKADGDLLRAAGQQLLLDTTVEGYIAAPGEQGRTRLYWLELKINDSLEIVQTAKDTLKPDFVLFSEWGSYIGSTSYSVEHTDLVQGDKILRKRYTVDHAGYYGLVVRPYQGWGQIDPALPAGGFGKYELQISCTGGPCAGEYPDPDALQLSEAMSCIGKARLCAFDSVTQGLSLADENQGRQLLDTCLTTVALDDGRGCAKACAFVDEEDEDDVDHPAAEQLCAQIGEVLPLFAGQPEACFDTFDSCMSGCYEAGSYGYQGDGIYGQQEYMCWMSIFNGACHAYVLEHEHCGGTTYKADTWASCCEMIHVTAGAWIDDLDTYCEDYCNDEYCEGELQTCNTQCAEDEDPEQCVETCLDDNEAWGCF